MLFDFQKEANVKLKKGNCSRYTTLAAAYIVFGICVICILYTWTGKYFAVPILIPMVIAYTIILREGFSSNTFTYIKSLMSIKHASEHFEMVKNKAPYIVWKVQCYHYTGYNKRPPIPGYPEPRPIESHTREDQKVTYEESRVFQFQSCDDVTGPAEPFHSIALTRVRHLIKYLS